MTKQAKIAQQIKRYIRQVADADEKIHEPGSLFYSEADKMLSRDAKHFYRQCEKFQKNAEILAKNADSDADRKYYTQWRDRAQKLSRQFEALINSPAKKMYKSGIPAYNFNFLVMVPLNDRYKAFGPKISSEYEKVKTALNRRKK